MDLEDLSQPARVVKSGRETFNLVADNEVKLRIAGVDEIEVTVPSGKVWTIYVTIDIVETNA